MYLKKHLADMMIIAYSHQILNIMNNN